MAIVTVHGQRNRGSRQMTAFKSLRSRNSGSPSMRWQGRLPNVFAERTLKNRGIDLDLDAARPTVKNVAPDSQFEKMGVKVDDIIDEVNRKPVDTLVQINRSLRSRNKVELKIVRDGESIKLDSPK